MAFVGGDFSTNNILASVQYEKEDLCICLTEDYQFVLTQDQQRCVPNETTKDYSKILGITDVSGEDYGCNCC